MLKSLTGRSDFVVRFVDGGSPAPAVVEVMRFLVSFFSTFQ